MQTTFTYIGTVRGQGRPRFGRHGAYENPKDTAYKTELQEAYRRHCAIVFPDEPLLVSIAVMRCLPKSRPKRIKFEQDTCKPDIDNIAKAVLDALNGLAWVDDKQVADLYVLKFPRIRFDDGLDRMRITIATIDNDLVYPYLFEVE